MLSRIFPCFDFKISSIPNAGQLFDMALGAYDFELVLFVAERSQKDPKEFLPFLNELKGYPEHYRKYKIDRHLKRNESALTHIVAQCLAGIHGHTTTIIDFFLT